MDYEVNQKTSGRITDRPVSDGGGKLKIKIKKDIPRWVIKNIAEEKNVSEKEIYSKMQTAIEIGYNNLDPSGKEFWNNIFPSGEMPTPEKLIEVLAQKIIN